MVSIICATYNHEKYIGRALESFVTQETTFVYEILVHDDASTDKTADIVREYEQAYPEIIRSVIQKENQYTTNKFVEDTFLIPLAKGKYIAECEGDDFWLDPLKLQKQFDFMEAHPNCSMHTHASLIVRAADEKKLKVFTAAPAPKYLSTEEIISNDNLVSTNSFFYLKSHLKDSKDFMHTAPVGDYPLTIWMSLKGEVYYSDEIMSAYRVAVENSWTDTLMKSPEALTTHFTEMESWLRRLNVYTDYKYSETIKNHIQKNRFKLNRASYNLKEITKEELINYYRELGILEKMKLNIGYYIPFSLKVSNFLRQNMHGPYNQESD